MFLNSGLISEGTCSQWLLAVWNKMSSRMTSFFTLLSKRQTWVGARPFSQCDWKTSKQWNTKLKGQEKVVFPRLKKIPLKFQSSLQNGTFSRLDLFISLVLMICEGEGCSSFDARPFWGHVIEWSLDQWLQTSRMLSVFAVEKTSWFLFTKGCL